MYDQIRNIGGNAKSSMRTLVRTAAVWVGPRSIPFDLVRIYAFSLIVTFFFLYFGDITVEHGSYDYVHVAQAIIGDWDFGGRPPQGPWGRDIGMALVWLISGYQFTQSLTGVIVIQAVMAITMPVLAYLSLQPWLPRTAYWTALAATLSLAPVLMMKTIHHDQPYIFFTVVSLYLFNRYMLTKLPRYLYAVTGALFAVGLVRQAGYGQFWPLMPICWWRGGNRSLKHIALAAVVFAGGSMAYAKYRNSLMGEFGVPGVSIFHNFYVNMAEYGVALDPDMGPNVELILGRVRECALPSPAESESLRKWPGPHDYIDKIFFDNTTDELVAKVASQSNLQYFFFIVSCVGGKRDYGTLDRILMGASIEIARTHPQFVLRLFFRNSLELLYNPGWLHNTYESRPQFQGGLLFPFGDIGTLRDGGPMYDDRFPQRNQNEASFIPLERQRRLIASVYNSIYQTWYGYYHPVTVIVGILSWLAWISTAIGICHSALGGPLLGRWSRVWLSERIVPASIGISVLLLENVAITAIAEETIYRYDYSLSMLKIMLGGVGCAALFALLSHLYRNIAPTLGGVCGVWRISKVGLRASTDLGVTERRLGVESGC